MKKGKKVVFTIITYCIPFLFFIILELGLRAFGYGKEYPLFVEDTISPDYLFMNRDVSLRYFSSQDYATVGQYDVFRKAKQSNTFRVFVQGASTSAGFPYNHSLSFPRLLEQKLQYFSPNREIEVINTSLTAVNSFTLLDFTDEIIEQKPDLVIIYAGHNEYYGALGVGSSQRIGKSYLLTGLYLKYKNYRTLQLIRSFVGQFTEQAASDQNDETLMTRMIEDEGIVFGSKVYQQGIEQYQVNMGELLKRYKEADVPVFICDIVSNLKDHKPFKSDTIQFIAKESFSDAEKLFLKGDLQQSKTKYVEAKNYDLLKFRAPTDIEESIRELAKQYDAKLIPIRNAFEQRSPSGIPGNDLLLEHVHPNVDGQKLMADVLFDYITKEESLKLNIASDLDPYSYYYTRLDSTFGVQLIEQLMTKWPFTERGATQVNRNQAGLSERQKLAIELINNDVTWVEAMDKEYRLALEQDLPEAIRLAKSLRQEYPHLLQPHLFVAQSLMLNGETEKAKLALAKIPAYLKTDEVPAMFVDIYLREEQYSKALSAAKELYATNKSNANNFKVKALQDIDKVDLNANIDQLVAPELYISAAGALIYLRKYDKAQSILLGVQKRFPNNPDVIVLLGQLKRN